ncbi:MAG TPA: hypothetical protein VJ851_01430 [Jatrophihabitans sp.]|nr:hypothetical protein [Jatrophihabitans sp.]
MLDTVGRAGAAALDIVGSELVTAVVLFIEPVGWFTGIGWRVQPVQPITSTSATAAYRNQAIRPSCRTARRR